MKAGRIDANRKWLPTDAPDAQFAAVHGGIRDGAQMLYLTSRQQREILIGDGEAGWSEVALPLRNTEITIVAPDPFSRNRFYVGTLGEGIYIYEGLTRRYVARDAQQPQAMPGGSQ